MLEQTRQTVPFDDLTLAKLYHVLRNNGYDPERLSRVRPAQIVYALRWDVDAENDYQTHKTELRKSMTITNNDASLISNIQFSIQDARYATDNTAQGGEWPGWTVVEDVSVFCAPKNALDYIRMQVRQNSNEQLSTDYVPLSHWQNLASDTRPGWMPSQLDFIPGGNYSSYELRFEIPETIRVAKLDISLTAIQLIGL